MGGRGSSSATSKVSTVRAELRAIAGTQASSPRDQEYARLAGVAAEMVGTSRGAELAEDIAIDNLSRYINVPSAARIEQVANGTGGTTGLSASAYANLGALVRTTAARGYTYDEIAAATQFRNWFKRAG